MKNYFLLLFTLSIFTLGFNVLNLSAEEVSGNAENIIRTWDSSLGNVYYKDDVVFNESTKEIKKVIQDFTTNGDQNWWSADSLFFDLTNVSEITSYSMFPVEEYGSELSLFLDNEIYTLNAIGMPELNSDYENEVFSISGHTVSFEEFEDDILINIDGDTYYLLESNTEIIEKPQTFAATASKGYRYSYTSKTTNKELSNAFNYVSLATTAAGYKVSSVKVRGILGTVSLASAITSTVLNFYKTYYYTTDVYVSNSCIHKGYTNKYAYQHSNYTGLLKKWIGVGFDKTNSYQKCYQ